MRGGGEKRPSAPEVEAEEIVQCGGETMVVRYGRTQKKQRIKQLGGGRKPGDRLALSARMASSRGAQRASRASRRIP